VSAEPVDPPERSPAEQMRTTLARCAVVSTFDDAMYQKLRVVGGPQVEDLTANGVVQQLPGAKRRFRVPHALRRAAWTAANWRVEKDGSLPSAAVSVARDMQKWCRDNDRPVERLRLLLQVDLGEAVPLFVDEFARRREERDGATCAALVSVVEDALAGGVALPADQRAILESQVAEFRADLGVLELGRRRHHDKDTYLSRPRLQDEITAHLKNDDPVLVTGSAGQGKTTLLTWLVEQHVDGVLRGRRRYTACAVLDLDADHPALELIDHPVLALLEIAHQIGSQVVGGGPFAAMAARQPAIRLKAGAPGFDDDGETVRTRGEFVAALRTSAAAERPVLVVLDTFEDAMLHVRDKAEKLLGVLDHILAEEPARLRLVVSGRAPADGDTVKAALRSAEPVEVGPFTRDETHAFLTARWAGKPVVRPTALADVLFDKTGGTPWDLALGAVTVAADPGITPAALRALDIEAVWAADRVLNRIRERDLRWIVLLGTLTRRLDPDLVTDVLRPAAERIAREVTPLAKQRPERFRGSTPLRPGADLWRDLDRYRGSERTSWVRTDPDAEPPDVVTLDPHLRRALGRVAASGHRVADVHSALAARLDRRAAERGPGWFTDLRDALFHHARSTGEVDGARWRDAAAAARKAGRPDWTLALVADLLGGPDPAGGDVTVPDDVLAEARRERAWATSRVARRGGSGRWAAVEDDLNTAGDRSWLSYAALAAVAVHEQDFPRAVRLAVSARAGAPDAADVRELHLVEADAARGTGAVEAERVALTAALAAAPGDRDRADVLGRLVELDLRRGDPDAADAAARRLPDGDRARWAARIALDSGLPAVALTRTRDGAFAPERVAALVAVGRAAAGRELCDTELTELRRAARPDVAQRHAAATVRAARGAAHAALLAVDAAEADLAAAAREFRRLGDQAAALAAGERLARLYLRDIGDLRAAQEQLALLGRTAGAPGSPSWIRHRLLRAELAHRREDTAGAEDLIRAVSAVVFPAAVERADGRAPREVPAPLRVRVGVAALAFTADPGEWPARLAAALRAVPHPGARLVALRDAALIPTGRLTPELVDGIPGDDILGDDILGDDILGDDILGDDIPGGAESRSTDLPADTGWRQLRLAEVLRAGGRTAEALAAVLGARRALDDSAGLDCLAAVLRIAQASEPIGRAVLSRVDRRRPGRDGSRLLRAAYLSTLVDLRATRRLGRPGWLAAAWNGDADLLDEAMDLLAPWSGGSTRVTSWHLRLHRQRRARSAFWNRAELDRLIRRTEVALGYAAGEPEPARADDPDPRLVVRFADQGGPLTVRAGPDGEEVRLETGSPVVLALRRPGGGRDALAAALRGLVTDPADPARDLARDVDPEPLPTPVAAPGERDLAIVTGAGPAAQLPWELALSDGAEPAPGRCVYRDHAPTDGRVEIRVLQETLDTLGHDVGPLDGDLGPVTRDAARAFGAAQGRLTEVDPLLWRAVREVSRATPDRRGTVRVVDRVAGWAPDDPDEPVPDVLHLRCGVEDGAEDPGPARLRFPDGALTVAEVGAVLRRATARRRRTPQIVLDVLGTDDTGRNVDGRNIDGRKSDGRNSDGEELLRRLLLRNAFAAALVESGDAVAVLATGLAVPEVATRWDVALGEWLRAGPTLADVAAAVRHAEYPAGARLAERLPWRATALFTGVRPTRLPTVWRPSR
jgi:peptidoglycan hydrolase-like protein with peptidoglycan-binding domain